MIPFGNVVAFSLASAAIIVIPGPSVLFVIGRALSLGRIGALLSVLGNALGEFVQVLAIAAGLGTIIQESVVLFTVLKFVGAAFLIYLGVQAIRKRAARVPVRVNEVRQGTFRTLSEGILVGVTNPKTAIFLAAVLPQFVAPDAGRVQLQLLLLGAIFLGIALVLDSTWALAAGSARDWFARSPKRVSNLGAAGGVAMIGLGAGLTLVGAQK